MTAPANGLTIDYAACGRNGHATLTARLNGDLLAVEKVDLTKGTARGAFAQTLCTDRPGIDRGSLDAELLRIAAAIATKPAGIAPAADTMNEIDASRIIRPERFIVPEASGLAVPTMMAAGNKVAGRWTLYLRWPDGRRESVAMPNSIDVGAGGKLWVSPEPPTPTASLRAGWSRESRAEWLAGSSAPNPAEVFRRVCERLAHYVDFPREHAQGTTATLALWVLLTYSYLAWDAVPYLYIGGPAHSGKTRVLKLLGRLAFRPLESSNLTAAAMFRTLHAQGGALLYDEAEGLRRSNDPAGLADTKSGSEREWTKRR